MRIPWAGPALACLLLSLAAVDALACRCAPRPLAAYFAEADLVFLGLGLTARPVDHAASATQAIDFELIEDPFRWRHAARPGPSVRILTASSTATCGLQLDAGALYVVFAWRDGDGSYHTDTCSGTRVATGRRAADDDLFIDLPARFLIPQLTALQGLDVLRDVEAHYPRPGNAADSGPIGLVELPWSSRDSGVRLFAAPDDASEEILRVGDYSQLSQREMAYERPSAEVYARRGDWFRLRTTDGARVWAQSSEAGAFVPYRELLTRRLSYLTESWSGLLWPDAGAGLPFRLAVSASPDRPREIPADILDSQHIGGMLWLHVRVLVKSPCSGNGDTTSRGGGWIPAYGHDGHPNAWFHARGC